MVLTDKQAAFVRAYLLDGKQKDAAISAGYSPATADQSASRLLKHPAIVEALAKACNAATVPAEPEGAMPETSDPKEFLLSVMQNEEMDEKVRIDAAKALLPFMHAKLGEGGKKDQKSAAAKGAGAGKFAPSAPPKLAIVGSK